MSDVAIIVDNPVICTLCRGMLVRQWSDGDPIPVYRHDLGVDEPPPISSLHLHGPYAACANWGKKYRVLVRPEIVEEIPCTPSTS